MARSSFFTLEEESVIVCVIRLDTIGERITITCKVSRPRFQANKFLKTGSARSACSARLTILKFEYDQSPQRTLFCRITRLFIFLILKIWETIFSYHIIFIISSEFIFLSKYINILLQELYVSPLKLSFLIFCDN